MVMKMTLVFLWACDTQVQSSDMVASITAPSTLSCAKNVSEIQSHSFERKKLMGRDVVVVHKSTRSIAHYQNGTLREGACWNIGLGFTPEGHKKKEGDGKTPEGWYTIADWPPSQYYGAIILFYPNLTDVESGLKDGRITAVQSKKIKKQLRGGVLPEQHSPLGGQLLIHGGGNQSDWTLGCVAMENNDIDALRSGLNADKRAELLILP